MRAIEPEMVVDGKLDAIEDKDPWERYPNEPIYLYERFQTYLELGPTRTFRKAAVKLGLPPTSGSTWSKVAFEWNWRSRAEAWDELRFEESRQKRAEVMYSGMALDYERVDALKQIANREFHLVMDLLAKLSAGDATAFNPGLNRRYEVVKQSLDRTLEQLAAETGGRVKRISVLRDLRDYAIALAREQGYDETAAAEIAQLVAGDAK